MYRINGNQLSQLTLNRITEITMENKDRTIQKLTNREKQITDKVIRYLQGHGVFVQDEKPMKTDTKTPSEEDVDYNNKYGHRISKAGAIMLVRSVASNAFKIAGAYQGTDKAQMSKIVYHSAINGATLAVGLTNPTLAVAMATLNWIITPMVDYGIQNNYDTQRLNFKYDNYDTNRFSTYIYKDGKYVAQDTQRVKNTLLNRTSIS